MQVRDRERVFFNGVEGHIVTFWEWTGEAYVHAGKKFVPIVKKSKKKEAHALLIGLNWVALNDEPGESDHLRISEQLTVELLAEMFGLPNLVLASKIIEIRKQRGIL